MTTRLATIAAGLALLAVPPGAAVAQQKNTGPVLPTFPPGMSAPPSAAPPPAPAYRPAPPPPASAAPRTGNPDAERLAQALPLDPQTRELRDQLPADPRGTGQRLGLREPRGPATDLRGGRTPSPREIVDALAPR